MEVDSLVVSLGLDPADFLAGLNRIAASLQSIDQSLKDFAAGFADGCEEALRESEASASALTQQAQNAGSEGQAMGQRFAQAGQQGAVGVNRLSASTQQAAQKAAQAGQAMQGLGRQWGYFLQGIVTRFVAPMAGAIGIGSMVGTYLSGVGQVAQMYGRWTPQMEEWRKKQELLYRVNREDIELYRKGTLALMDFQFAMAGLSTTIMRALSPAIRAGIELLHQVADWVRRNEPNIIRFVTVLAGTITAVLIPACMKMTAAMLLNPITWIIAGILALALVIDDLVTYIRGGASALAEFWAMFGTGEEIAAKLGAAWGRLMEIGEGLWNTVKARAETFFSSFSGTIEAIQAQFTSLAHFISALLFGTWEDVGRSLREVFEAAINSLKTMFTEAATYLWNAIVSVVNDIPKAIGNITSNVGSAIKGFFGLGEDAEAPAPLAGAAPSAPLAGAAPSAPLAGNIPTSAQLTAIVPPTGDLLATGVPAHVTNTSTRTSNVQAQTTINTINVQTQATDADGVARELPGALRKTPLYAGVDAADGGVY